MEQKSKPSNVQFVMILIFAFGPPATLLWLGSKDTRWYLALIPYTYFAYTLWAREKGATWGQIVKVTLAVLITLAIIAGLIVLFLPVVVLVLVIYGIIAFFAGPEWIIIIFRR